MGDIVKFCDENADLKHPSWYYKAAEEMAHLTYDAYAHLATGPLADVTIDELFEMALEVPVRLMALKEGDPDIERFIVNSMAFHFVTKRISTARTIQ